MDTIVEKSDWKFTQFSKQDLINISEGFGPSGFPMLPRGDMLMIDRITAIDKVGGKFGHGYITAELDINPRLWFFQCHFKNDPIMPGSLGVDGLCQLLGFYLGWYGFQGKGRALSLGKTKYLSEINSQSSTLEYNLI